MIWYDLGDSMVELRGCIRKVDYLKDTPKTYEIQSDTYRLFKGKSLSERDSIFENMKAKIKEKSDES